MTQMSSTNITMIHGPHLSEGALLSIVLVKSARRADATWPSLLRDGGYAPDPVTLDNMQKKMTLERFQKEVG